MAKILALLFVILIVTNVFAQDVKIVSRVPNVKRIARNWNVIADDVPEWNQAMTKASLLLQASFSGQVLDLNEERRQKLEHERRRARVAYYKTARETIIKQLEALNELIDEEDY